MPDRAGRAHRGEGQEDGILAVEAEDSTSEADDGYAADQEDAGGQQPLLSRQQRSRSGRGRHQGTGGRGSRQWDIERERDWRRQRRQEQRGTGPSEPVPQPEKSQVRSACETLLVATLILVLVLFVWGPLYSYVLTYWVAVAMQCSTYSKSERYCGLKGDLAAFAISVPLISPVCLIPWGYFTYLHVKVVKAWRRWQHRKALEREMRVEFTRRREAEREGRVQEGPTDTTEGGQLHQPPAQTPPAPTAPTRWWEQAETEEEEEDSLPPYATPPPPQSTCSSNSNRRRRQPPAASPPPYTTLPGRGHRRTRPSAPPAPPPPPPGPIPPPEGFSDSSSATARIIVRPQQELEASSQEEEAEPLLAHGGRGRGPTGEEGSRGTDDRESGARSRLAEDPGEGPSGMGRSEQGQAIGVLEQGDAGESVVTLSVEHFCTLHTTWQPIASNYAFFL